MYIYIYISYVYIYIHMYIYIHNCIESHHTLTSIPIYIHWCRVYFRPSTFFAQDAGHHSFPGQVEGHADAASAPGHCDGWGAGSWGAGDYTSDYHNYGIIMIIVVDGIIIIMIIMVDGIIIINQTFSWDLVQLEDDYHTAGVWKTLSSALRTIQRTYRGRLYGRRPMQEMREARCWGIFLEHIFKMGMGKAIININIFGGITIH